MLLNEPELLKIYEDYIELHADLEHRSKKPILLKKQKKWQRKTWLGALAAILVIAFILQKPKIHGVIINSRDAVWQDQTFITKNTYKLITGIAQLKLDKVILTLEAPLELELISSKKVHLKYGNLVARVKKGGEGFELKTNKAKIIDLGTEFCVNASNDKTEVHVSKGKVLSQGSAQQVELNENQGIVYENKIERRIHAQPELFVRALPGSSTENPNYIHWSFDKLQKQEVLSRSQGFDPYPATIHSDPLFTSGIFGNAINFDGDDDFLSTSFPGIEGHSPRTISFWVKIPKNAPIKNAISMLAWGSYKYPGNTFQISWNWNKKEGNFGALRAGLWKGQIVAKNDLRDDQWHHVAIVVYGGSKADVSSHILLYLDGELQTTAQKSVLPIATDTQSDESIKLLMGRDAKNYLLNKDNPKTFLGSLDEVYLFDAALSSEQIRSLQSKNSLH